MNIRKHKKFIYCHITIYLFNYKYLSVFFIYKCLIKTFIYFLFTAQRFQGKMLILAGAPEDFVHPFKQRFDNVCK